MRNYSGLVVVVGMLAGFLSPFSNCVAEERQVDAIAAPTRILDIQSIINFRDIGGYTTVNGRSTKWRKVFRSGDMSRFAAKEQPVVSALGINMVVDLRSSEERLRGPSRWYDEASRPEIVLLPIGGSAADWSSSLSRQLQTGGFSRAELHATFIEMYATVPLDNTLEYRALFNALLANGDEPVLIHCTGGKDRTGIAAALILAALDVPRVTIMHDFLLTNEAIDVARTAKMLAMIFSRDADSQIEPVAIEPMLVVDPVYLETAFAAIEAEYGSLDNYFRVALGLTAARRAELRAVLLD